MSVEATIETEYGERLLVWRASGFPGGQGVESFLNVLINYCFEDEGDVRSQEVDDWFARLESVSGQSICELTKPLRTGFYYGTWGYTEDEYERFLVEARDMPLSEAEFKQRLRHIDSTWVPADKMLNVVTTLVDLLTETDLEATWWYDPQGTLDDFRALKEAVEIANRAPECKMRIQFS